MNRRREKGVRRGKNWEMEGVGSGGIRGGRRERRGGVRAGGDKRKKGRGRGSRE
jgi:hypothetical protein